MSDIHDDLEAQNDRIKAAEIAYREAENRSDFLGMTKAVKEIEDCHRLIEDIKRDALITQQRDLQDRATAAYRAKQDKDWR